MKKLFALLGPGIVFAATSIGVSHVVQSTRAGADFGYSLVALIIVAHLVKLPFFQVGPRYAAATGESLLDAYRTIGGWAYAFVIIFTFCTMFIVMAAVTVVAAGILANIVDIGFNIGVWAAILLVFVISVLMTGGYKWLDALLKFMMLVFAITCLITFVAVLVKDVPTAPAQEINFLAPASIAFIVALIGWMPTTIEVSVWHSFWVIEQRKKEFDDGAVISEQDLKRQTKQRLFDFNFSYVFCCVFALVFVVLGAKLLFGQGVSLSNNAIGFSAQLIGIFTSALGDWSQPIVSVLIFIAMFSTCIAVADGFGHVMARMVENSDWASTKLKQHSYNLILPVIAVGGWGVIALFSGQLKALIDFATTVSFVAAPVFAWLNLRSMSLPQVPEALRLTSGFILYARVCLGMLAAFSLFYIVWRFF